MLLPRLSRNPSSTSQNGDSSSKEKTEGPSKTIKDFRDQIKKGLPISLETSTLASIVDAIRHTDSIDDRKFLLEHALVFVSKLPAGHFQETLQNRIVELLYNDLPHPPATSIGSQYAWRAADGSFNNPTVPTLGASGTPYARSVQQTHPLPKHELPDPSLIFDTLLRREKFVKHPAGLSSLMFAFAALVIHTVFRTSHQDMNVNETSSYVDLSPLYGHGEAEQDAVRDKSGRGLLKPDVFAEDRLLLLPPAVCTLLVLFSRNHNYIATKLLEINERGTFVDPAGLSGDRLVHQDEELFQTARLVNCGWFGSVVFSDYFSCILGLVRQGSSWSLNPFGEIRNADHSVFPRGQGNVCSVEFNCLYRWHATTSEHDEKWVAKVFDTIFEGKSPDNVTPADFKAAAARVKSMTPDITQWTFGSIQRNDQGYFADDDLANILQTSTEHPAAAFGARGTPDCMRLHEMMGIEQNRVWGVCSLNDFRKYLGLKPYTTFLEWNSSPEIADAAEKLYGKIDYLELYVGLQAEEAKPVMDGAGLCPGYTISRAILSDAIALTRGDRFFTHDFTPFNLTAWGFQDCQRDPDAFGFGSMLSRLFLRTLPDRFAENSVYAFFPLMTPDSMKVHLKKLQAFEEYDFAKPKKQIPTQVITDYSRIDGILKAPEFEETSVVDRANKVIKGLGFYLTEAKGQQEAVAAALAKCEAGIVNFFQSKTQELIQESSYLLVHKKVRAIDIVRDVYKTVPIYWVADVLGFQLKTKTSPDGHYSPDELFTILAEIYEYIFLQPDASQLMVLRAKVESNIKKLQQHIKSQVTAMHRLSAGFTSIISKPKKVDQHEVLKHLRESSQSTEQLVNMLLALMVGATVELSLAVTNVTNVYLGSAHQDKLGALAIEPKNSLAAFVREGLRLDPPFKGVSRTASKDALGFAHGTKLFLDVAHASLEPTVYPNATNVDLSRASGKSLPITRCFKCLGEQLTMKIIGQIVGVVFSAKGLERAPGQSGILKRFKDEERKELCYAYLDNRKRVSPWPTSLFVQFEAQ